MADATPATSNAPASPVLQSDWVLLPIADHPRSRIGRRVDLAALVARLEVGPDVRVALAPPSDPIPLDALAPTLTSDRWVASEALADTRLATKLGLLVGLGVVTLGLAIVGLWLYRRRARAIDARGQLLAAVSHEIKTPIASIRALAETLEARLAEEPRARDYPTRIVAAADRLTWLVSNVLSWSRLDRSAWRLRKSRFRVADLAAWIASDTALMQDAPAARHQPSHPRKVAFQANVPPELELEADLDLVKILCSNLVDNAIKYATRDTVRITFDIVCTPTKVTLLIRDDGPGISPEARATIFRAYHRGPAPQAGPAGHGLGLAIARQIMALHRGRLQLAATGPDGTTFEATFPR